MTPGKLQESVHPTTLRSVILDDDGVSVWCYLTEPSNRRPVADCIACNRIPLIDPDDMERYRNGPPPLTTRYGRDEAVISSDAERPFGFRWATDGESVAVLLDDQPWAMLRADTTRGMTKAVERSGPFGNAWDADYWAQFDRG